MASKSASNATNFRINDGDWVCDDPNCANVNFARRQSCNLCGRDKPNDKSDKSKKKLGYEIGKAAADKSKGLFSADDWQCGRCGNVNWARRQQCNMCNAPKFGENEERTGLGGGYNERDNVEYIQRGESDDEYDDFGRKKKKLKTDKSDDNDDTNDSDHKRYDNLSKHKNVTHNDDDDDDDDDDSADVSKYKLDSDDDDSNDHNDRNRNISKYKHESDEEEDDDDDDDDDGGDVSKYKLESDDDS